MSYTKKRSRSKSLKKYKKSNRSKPKYGKRKNSLKKNNKKRSKSRSNKRTRSRSKSKTNKRSIKRSRSRSRSRKNRHKGGSKCLQKQTGGKCKNCNKCNQCGGKCKNCNKCNQHGGKCKNCNKCNQHGGKCKNCNKCNQHGGKCKNCNQHGCKCNQCGGKCNLCNQLGGDDVDDINKLLGLTSVKTKQEQRYRTRNHPKRLINEKVIKIPRKKLTSNEKGKGIAKNRAHMKVDVKKIINKEIDSHIKDCKVYKKCDNNFKYNKKLGFGTCPDDNCYYINKINADKLKLPTYGCYKCDYETATNQLALDLGLLSF